MNSRILAQDVYQDNNTWKTRLNNNDLIIGPSGSGKTRGYVIPNILQGNESMIVADTKGDLKDKLSPYLRSEGYTIKHINFKDVFLSEGYNPLDFISFNERTGLYYEQDILTISHALVPDIEGDKDPYWNSSARMYLTSMIAYVLEACEPQEHTLNRVFDTFLSFSATSFHEKMVALYNENINSYAFRIYLLYKNNIKAERMDASIRGVLSEKLSNLFGTDLNKMYKKRNRIDFGDLEKEKTVVFLSISDVDRSMDRLVNIFYAQAFQVLTSRADKNSDNRLGIPVRFILDDFATNTVIKDFDNITSVIRSREIYVSIIIQSLTQLDAIYGEYKTSTITNNCDNWLYLGGQDVRTAKVFAQKTNISVINILQMELDDAYLFTRGSRAKKVQKFELKEHTAYKNSEEKQMEENYIVDNLPF